MFLSYQLQKKRETMMRFVIFHFLLSLLLLNTQEHFSALFSQLPLKLRRSAPFTLPSKYAEQDDEDEDDEEDEEEEGTAASDEAKAQGLAACSDFVFKLFPDAKVDIMKTYGANVRGKNRFLCIVYLKTRSFAVQCFAKITVNSSPLLCAFPLSICRFSVF